MEPLEGFFGVDGVSKSQGQAPGMDGPKTLSKIHVV